MRLLRVELRRLRLRRLVLFTALFGLLGAVFLVTITALDARPASGEDLAWAQEQYEQARQDWAENGEQQVADCKAAEAADAAESGEVLDYGCDEMEPREDWFLPYTPVLTEYVDALILPFAIGLALVVGVIIGATAVAAEFSSGSMTTLLTFEPRRLRVYAAKLGAAFLGTVPLSLLIVATLSVGTWALFELRGMDSRLPATMIWAWARLLVVLPAAAVFGGVLAFLLRSTGAVLGAVIGYAVVVEAILRMSVSRLSPWIPGVNLTGWVAGGTSYGVTECVRTPQDGLVCDWVSRDISFTWSIGFLVILAGTLLALTAWSFQRRDVD